jgi:hypothetical protein
MSDSSDFAAPVATVVPDLLSAAGVGARSMRIHGKIFVAPETMTFLNGDGR